MIWASKLDGNGRLTAAASGGVTQNLITVLPVSSLAPDQQFVFDHPNSFITVSMLGRNKKAIVTPLLSCGCLALGASLAAHTGVAVLAHAHRALRTDVHALREITLETLDVLPALAAEREQARESHTTASATVHPTPVARQVATQGPVGGSDPQPILAESSAPSATSENAVPAALRFAIQAPSVSAGPANHRGTIAQPNGDTAGPDAPVAENLVDLPAKLLRGGPPNYTAAAELAGVEAEIPVELVIDAQGSVRSARALTHIGYGLDEAALAAVRSYHFAPARRTNKLVAVRMRWIMRFQLR
ncbi:MAG: energy transducer TonB [Dokdonella sp.]